MVGLVWLSQCAEAHKYESTFMRDHTTHTPVHGHVRHVGRDELEVLLPPGHTKAGRLFDRGVDQGAGREGIWRVFLPFSSALVSK